MRALFGSLGLSLLLLLALPVGAQDMATLVADRVAISGKNTLIAQGGVEIFHKGQRLKASKITYLPDENRLVIEGPLVLSDDSGTVILAEQADLSTDMTEGVLQSARLVLNQQLQLASAEILRVGGRYTSMGRSVASSCKICAANPTPLWEIRARRIVHDEQERQIYFDNAHLRLRGIPVLWIPYLRMPDPSLKRTSGFLTPSLRSTVGLGFGVSLPYFVKIGDHRDLTITPHLASKSAAALELRYRQAFANGKIEISGTVARDQMLVGKTRRYLAADAEFSLRDGYKLTFSGETVSDQDYLSDYDISDKDYVDSRLELSRTKRHEYILGRLIHFQTLDSSKTQSQLPSIMADVTWERRFSPALIGGNGGLKFQAHSHYRSSNSNLDSNSDGVGDGRDMARFSLATDWRRSWVLPAGVLASLAGELRSDFYTIRQDAVYSGRKTRSHGALAVDLRWPWARTGADGVGHVIEPIAQFIWSPKSTSSIPNEDSVISEFDAGNLFSFGRFPGSDAVERGPRANLGLSYTRFDPAGWSLGLTFGRVIRSQDFGQFSSASGLSGRNSDWLSAIRFSFADSVVVTNRLLFNDKFNVSKAELRFDISRQKYSISSAFVWMKPEAAEGRTDHVKELSLAGGYRFGDNWETKFVTRYDLMTNRAASAGLNMGFRNECLQLDMSLSQRFTNSTSLSGSTNFKLSLDLIGFGNTAATVAARACRG